MGFFGLLMFAEILKKIKHKFTFSHAEHNE